MMRFLWLIFAVVVVTQARANSAEFIPKDLDNLVFFVKSVRGMAVATNDTQTAYDATNEFTSLDDLWSDQQRFPKGRYCCCHRLQRRTGGKREAAGSRLSESNLLVV